MDSFPCSLLTTAFNQFINLFQNKFQVVPEYAKMQFRMMTLLDVLDKNKISYPRVKSQIVSSGVQEKTLCPSHCICLYQANVT